MGEVDPRKVRSEFVILATINRSKQLTYRWVVTSAFFASLARDRESALPSWFTISIMRLVGTRRTRRIRTTRSPRVLFVAECKHVLNTYAYTARVITRRVTLHRSRFGMVTSPSGPARHKSCSYRHLCLARRAECAKLISNGLAPPINYINRC